MRERGGEKEAATTTVRLVTQLWTKVKRGEGIRRRRRREVLQPHFFISSSRRIHRTNAMIYAMSERKEKCWVGLGWGLLACYVSSLPSFLQPFCRKESSSLRCAAMPGFSPFLSCSLLGKWAINQIILLPPPPPALHFYYTTSSVHAIRILSIAE